MLDDNEVRILAMMFAAARGDRAFTEAEFEEVLEWANGVLIEYGTLQNVLAGHLTVELKDGEPVFSMAKKGIAKVEAMGLDQS